MSTDGSAGCRGRSGGDHSLVPLALKRGTGPTGVGACPIAESWELTPWRMLLRYHGYSVSGEEPDISLLEAFGNLFESPSSAVLIEASAALEKFAPLQKARAATRPRLTRLCRTTVPKVCPSSSQVAICHAKLVARLIALSHSDDLDVSIAGGRVLRALSTSVAVRVA